MDVTVVDRSATAGRSALHATAPTVKVAAFVLVLAAIVVTANLFVVLAIGLTLTAVLVGLRLPARAMLPLALYPAPFAAMFAFASAPEVLTAALVVMKAVTVALAAVMLMFTTPYPQVFSIVQRLMPSLAGDTLLMTYRVLFLLAEKLTQLTRAVRLRSGLAAHRPARAARTAAQALGGLVLYSLDLAQREYDVLLLRGYESRLRVTALRSTSHASDAATMAVAVAALATAVTWRLAWRDLNDYSWMLPALALLALGGILIGRRGR